MKIADTAARIVSAPSMKKSHLKMASQILLERAEVDVIYLQAACPSFPSIPSRIPEAMREPKALLIKLPQERSAVRTPSSLRVYHFERRKSAPGKNAASTKPRKNRVRSAPTKL